jgi:hypothetical protein
MKETPWFVALTPTGRRINLDVSDVRQRTSRAEREHRASDKDGNSRVACIDVVVQDTWNGPDRELRRRV